MPSASFIEIESDPKFGADRRSKEQEAFRNNYERLKAERLAREAAKSEDK
jgi:hypothetical protein